MLVIATRHCHYCSDRYVTPSLHHFLTQGDTKTKKKGVAWEGVRIVPVRGEPPGGGRGGTPDHSRGT